ncbi:MAG: hypothetical protein EOP64_00060 [Sphingomonas sp.]|nr:MAG: hypothetical protein EOP64_00060 [Sphingomonas sp.]
MAMTKLTPMTKLLLTSAINGLTVAIHMAIEHIPDEDKDLRDGLGELSEKAMQILQKIISGAHEPAAE